MNYWLNFGRWNHIESENLMGPKNHRKTYKKFDSRTKNHLFSYIHFSAPRLAYSVAVLVNSVDWFDHFDWCGPWLERELRRCRRTGLIRPTRHYLQFYSFATYLFRLSPERCDSGTMVPSASPHAYSCPWVAPPWRPLSYKSCQSYRTWSGRCLNTSRRPSLHPRTLWRQCLWLLEFVSRCQCVMVGWCCS